MKQTIFGFRFLMVRNARRTPARSSPGMSSVTSTVGRLIRLIKLRAYVPKNLVSYMCLRHLSDLRSISLSSNSPALLRRYQNILLFEKGTPRRYDPGCGFMPTNRIFAFLDIL